VKPVGSAVLSFHGEGWLSSEIAEALGVSPAAVTRWIEAQRVRGRTAWHDQRHPGRPMKLTLEQRNMIPDLLSHGAEAYGFRGEFWSCARVASIIEREFGVSYHKAHVSRLLKALEWTPHKPVNCATQRDEEAIERWRTDCWPEHKNKAKIEGRTIVFVDESGFYLLPGLVRTYAPRGNEWSCAKSRHAITCR
jgi:transposase